MGALSRRFKTTPMLFCLKLTLSCSYIFPMYRFLDSSINGQNVFSYSKSCGALIVFLNAADACFAILIDGIIRECPIFDCTLSLSVTLNITNNESVSPYTILAL